MTEARCAGEKETPMHVPVEGQRFPAGVLSLRPAPGNGFPCESLACRTDREDCERAVAFAEVWPAEGGEALFAVGVCAACALSLGAEGARQAAAA